MTINAPGNMWQVINIEAATKNQARRLTVVATFPTREEAERFQRGEAKDVSVGVREKPLEPEPNDPRSGLIKLGEPLGRLADESRRAARPEVQERRAENLEKGRQLAEANKAIQQAGSQAERQQAIQQRNIISAKTPGQVYSEKIEKQRIETVPRGLLVTPVSETIKEKIQREEAGLSRTELSMRRTASTLRRQGYDAKIEGRLLTAMGAQRTQAIDVYTRKVVLGPTSPTLRLQPQFVNELKPMTEQRAFQETIAAALRRQGFADVNIHRGKIIGITPEGRLAKFETPPDRSQAIASIVPSGVDLKNVQALAFKSQLGTGKPKFYATGALGKAYVFGREIGAKARRITETQRGKEFISGAKVGAYPLTAPFKFAGNVFTKELSPTLKKGEEKSFRTADILYKKGFKPSDVSLSKQIPQQEKAYQSNKLMNFLSDKPIFHKSIEKTQQFKNLAKRGGYIAGGAIADIGGFALGTARYFGEKPIRIPLWHYGFKGATKAFGIIPTIGGAIAVPTALAPSGQKLRTTVGATGTILLLSGLGKGVLALKETPSEIKSVLARRRAVPKIIEEAIGKPYKAKPGLEGVPRIQEAIVRDKPIPGLERIKAEGITTGITKKGLLAVRPTAGADFKGIQRVPPIEPEPLTRKGNIIFKELGIEEAKILKPEPRAKKRVLSFAGFALEQFQPITTFGITTKSGRGQSIISYVKGQGVRLGTPDVSSYLKKLPRSEEIKVAGALETKAYIKAFQKIEGKRLYNVARGREGLQVMQNILRRTRKTKSKFIKELPKETERLPKVGVDILKDVTKREGWVIFGGFSREAQLADIIYRKGMPFERIPRLRDIDIRGDKASEAKLASVTREVLGRFRKKGIEARKIKDIPFSIEVRQPSGKFEKAIEFKGKEEIIKGEEVPEYILGFRKVGTPIKISKQKVTPLSEELRGVTQGVARIRKIKGKLDIFPSEKRMKDIGSVVVSSRTLLQSKRFFRKGLEKDIEKFEKIFPKKLIEEQLKGQKILLADYSPKEQAAKLGYSYLPTILNRSPFKSIPSQISKVQKIRSPKASSAFKSPSISRSISKSISKSMSPSRRTLSKSMSRSLSKSISQLRSPSISKSISKSLSISPSKSLSKSISQSISKSLSKSRSSSRSFSKSISSSTPSPPFKPPLIFRESTKTKSKKRKQQGFGYFYREFKFPDLSKVL